MSNNRDDKSEFSLNNKLSSSQSHSTFKKPTSQAIAAAIAVDTTPIVASKKQITVPKNATESDNQQLQQSQQQLLQNQLTSNLYANSQLANLIPLFNLPILGQILNGLKNNNNQLAQDMMTNLDSSSIINSTTSNINNNSNNNNNQPLNLTKDLTTNANNLTKQVKKPQQQASGSQPASLNSSNNNNGTTIKSQSSPSPSVSSTASSSTNQSHNANTSSNNSNNNTGGLKIANLSSLQALTSSSASAQLATQQKIEQLRSQANKLLAASGSSSFGHHHHHSSSSRKQRERTTFDPHEEITRLMQIFERTHHPTRYQIANICDFLNGLACRKDKKPLEPYNIQYWFKNARAALRRKNKSVGSGGDDATTLLNSFTVGNVASVSAAASAGETDNEIIDQILRSKPSMSSSAAAFKTREFMSSHRIGGSSGQMKLEQTGDLIDGYGDELDEDGKYSDFDEDEDELSEDDEDFLNPNEEENGQYEADYQLDHVKGEISHNLNSGRFKCSLN